MFPVGLGFLVPFLYLFFGLKRIYNKSKCVKLNDPYVDGQASASTLTNNPDAIVSYIVYVRTSSLFLTIDLRPLCTKVCIYAMFEYLDTLFG